VTPFDSETKAPHADTGALILSIYWIKRYFSVAFSSYLPPFFTNQRSVSKRWCLHEDPALRDLLQQAQCSFYCKAMMSVRIGGNIQAAKDSGSFLNDLL